MKKEILTEYEGGVSRREILKAGSTAAATLASTGILLAAAACNRSAAPVPPVKVATTGQEEKHLFKVLALWLAVATKGLPSPIPPSYHKDLLTASAFDSSTGDQGIFSAAYNWIVDASNRPVIDAAHNAYIQFLYAFNYTPAQCPQDIQSLSNFATVDPNKGCPICPTPAKQP